MKKIFILTAMLLSWMGNAQCITNGDFELGITTNYTFTIWDEEFTIEDCQINTSDPGFGPLVPPFSGTINDITSEGGSWTESPVAGVPVFDNILATSSPSVLMPVVHPASGTKAIKLNRSTGSSHITTMSVQIIPAGTIISFNYSFIASWHGNGDEDLEAFFTARIYDMNNNMVNLNEICMKADIANDDVFSQTARTANTILYTGWQCANLEIPSYLANHPLRLEFVVADCGDIGHFGTVYIDNISCSAVCEDTDLGYIILDETTKSCPTETFQVCGSFEEPINSTLDTGSLVLSLIDENGVETTVPSTATISGNDFCFDVDSADFGINPSGEFFVKVDALFNSTTTSYVFDLFDYSTIEFNPIDILESSYVFGDILYWEDVADSYTLEFISDGECCPNIQQPADGSYYSVTITDNFYNLDNAVNGMFSKCFRWRIKTDCGWSCWCCLADDAIVSTIDFPDANYGNVHSPNCYEGDLCELTLTIPNIIDNVVDANEGRYEHLSESIIAHNIIEDDGVGIYKAGQYILLSPTFNAQTGSVFSATIVPCDDACSASEDPLPRMNMVTSSQDNEMKEAFDAASAFTVYPNPTNGLITVTGQGASEFIITDITGKQLMTISNDSQSGSTDIDLSGLNAGIYFLSADGKTIQKIIKN